MTQQPVKYVNLIEYFPIVHVPNLKSVGFVSIVLRIVYNVIRMVVSNAHPIELAINVNVHPNIMMMV